MSGILKNIEWACDTIRNREKFGLDELNAARARERRAKGVLLDAKIEIENLQKQIEALKAELAKERSVVDKIEHCLDVFSISNLSRKNLLTIARQRQRERNEK